MDTFPKVCNGITNNLFRYIHEMNHGHILINNEMKKSTFWGNEIENENFQNKKHTNTTQHNWNCDEIKNKNTTKGIKSWTSFSNTEHYHLKRRDLSWVGNGNNAYFFYYVPHYFIGSKTRAAPLEINIDKYHLLINASPLISLKSLIRNSAIFCSS